MSNFLSSLAVLSETVFAFPRYCRYLFPMPRVYSGFPAVSIHMQFSNRKSFCVVYDDFDAAYEPRGTIISDKMKINVGHLPRAFSPENHHREHLPPSCRAITLNSETNSAGTNLILTQSTHITPNSIPSNPNHDPNNPAYTIVLPAFNKP